MRTKLLQLNDALKGDVVSHGDRFLSVCSRSHPLIPQTTSMLSASRAEMAVFDRIFAYLQNVAPVSVISASTAAGLKWYDVDVVLQVISKWPESQRFPCK